MACFREAFFLSFLLRLLVFLLAALDVTFEPAREAAVHASKLRTTLAELLLLLAGNILNLVGGALVTADVHAHFLLERINAEHVKVVEEVDVGSHDGKDPADDPKTGNDLNAHQREVAGATAPLVEPADVVGHAKGSLETAGSGEEAGGQDTPHTATKVDGDGIDSIIDLETDEKEGSGKVDPSRDHTNDKGSPRLDGSTGGGDGDKTSEASVHGRRQIVGDHASLALVDEGVGEQGAQGTGGSSNGSIDSGKRGSIAEAGGRNEEGSAGVETICAKKMDDEMEK